MKISKYHALSLVIKIFFQAFHLFRKRKEKQEKEEQKLKEKSKDEKEKPTEQIEPVTPRTDYDLKAPMFRYIKDTAENFENYLNEKSKEPFMNLYKEMEAVYNEYF